MISRRQFLAIGGLSLTTFGFVEQILAQSGEKLIPKIKEMVRGVELITKADYEARQEKARRLMAERGIDGLFLTASTNLVYFTGVQWRRSERTFGALLSRKKEPVWICPAFELERARELIPADQEIRTWEEHESPYALLAGIMKDLGASTGKLALGPTVRLFVYFGLRRDAPHLEIINVGGLKLLKR
jgi:Xaa-Pro dipeptidase